SLTDTSTLTRRELTVTTSSPPAPFWGFLSCCACVGAAPKGREMMAATMEVSTRSVSDGVRPRLTARVFLWRRPTRSLTLPVLTCAHCAVVKRRMSQESLTGTLHLRAVRLE